jgi:exodeoxyribonuclease-3
VLRLLTLNMQAAALPRAQALLDWLDNRDDDVVILTETSNGPGTAYLLRRCQEAGLSVTWTSSGDGDRGCAIISRLPATARTEMSAAVTLPGRAAVVTIHAGIDITVLGLYVPSSDRAPHKVAKKRAFLASVLTALEKAERGAFVVGGDYNVISRDHQPNYAAFLPFEYQFLDALVGLGLTEAHRHLHPGIQVHSWYGRGGNGYQFDYFHTGPALTGLVDGCSYVQEPRERGLSDHAAVTLTVNVGTPPTPPSPTLTAAGTLF